MASRDGRTCPGYLLGMRVGGLFAGIGGFERGLEQAGHGAAFFVDIDPAAQSVLRAHWADVPIQSDVAQLDDMGGAEIVYAEAGEPVDTCAMGQMQSS